MMRASTKRVRIGLLACAIVAAGLSLASSPAKDIFGGPNSGPTNFVTVRDGTQIAVNVRMPKPYIKGHRYPAIIDMSGYVGGSSTGPTLPGELGGPSAPLAEDDRQLTDYYNSHYVTVHMSLRGTGCSQGEFDLFSHASALDGYDVIEWMARQSWSNGKVGIEGHSYSGITGFLVGATRPPHLVAMTVSGLIDDIYRQQAYPGGVANDGFPLLWTVGIRNAYDILGAQAQPLLRSDPSDPQQEAVREQCIKNIATHTRTVGQDPIVQGATGQTDNDWYRSRSLITYVKDIKVPIIITGAYQDEQTSARGPAHLWEQIQGVPKRLVLSNGDHDTNNPCCGPRELVYDRLAWMDHWMRGDDTVARALGVAGAIKQRTSVRVLWEVHDTAGRMTTNEVTDYRTFPIPNATWKRYYFASNGLLTTVAPGANGGSDMYFSGTKRQAWNFELSNAGGPSTAYTAGTPLTTADAPDQLTYISAPFQRAAAFVGPVTANLWLSSLATDTEMFVQVIDQAPDGARSYLQRGLLKASHRAIDWARSDCLVPATSTRASCVTSGGSPNKNMFMYRPWRPDTDPQMITPGTPYNYLIEIWPIGWIIRPGHRLVVTVQAPPASDSIFIYVPSTIPTINTILHDAAHPSYITLPFVPAPSRLGPAIACGDMTAVRCVANPQG
ncbi:MAG: CocE/NonD family hydrolase [Actinobacteria bacterium]|nr:MAG: CocE/NonD family hydrolase [Actinomycetota bacterium]